ncbi:MAG TPA: chromosomal replication initiator protein DnaA [Phycisphaerae bacterium]|nr:chromosomal replication initiator protein DnaA [Phycisphaerae bacterium]
MGNFSDRSWSDVLVHVRNHRPELFRSWFNNIEPVDLQNGVIRARPSTRSHYEYLSRECQSAFTEAAQHVTGRLVTVMFEEPAEGPEPEAPLSFEEDADQIKLRPDYRFEHFVTGPCNRLAHAACIAVAENPGRVYNPLFVHGSVGLGKTHLLQATCHAIKDRQSDARILYISCETFVNHFIEAVERGAVHQFRYHYRHVDALVIDDIQFLADRERTREEFFHTFNTLYQSQKQIIISADESPANIPSLEERLVSRFNWGLVVRIDAPCLEVRMAILRKKARLRCVELPENVVHHVAANVTGNTRELEGALLKVIALSQQYGGVINLDVARQAIGDHVPDQVKPITITDILNVVTAHFGVRAADLQGKRRSRSIAFPRQVCMYLARELTSLSLEEIGGYFGGRDHTTVLHAARTISEQKKRDSELSATLAGMIRTLRPVD